MENNEASKKPKAIPRKLRKLGGSISVNLPLDFIKENGFKEGQYVLVSWNGDTIRITSITEETKSST